MSSAEPGRTLVFVDLDDTLFRTRRKATGPLGRAVTVTTSSARPSYMSPRQEHFFEKLRALGTLIPTTARTVKSLHRVSLPLSKMAVCTSGAVILDRNGDVDAEWDAHVARVMAALSVSPDELAESVVDRAGGTDVQVVYDGGRPINLSLRRSDRDADAIAAHAARIAPTIPPDWRCEPHIHEIVLQPKALGKAPAVRFLLAHRLETPSLTIGVGDRVSDAEFMALCDVAIAPTDSELFGVVLRSDTDGI